MNIAYSQGGTTKAASKKRSLNKEVNVTASPSKLVNPKYKLDHQLVPTNVFRKDQLAKRLLDLSDEHSPKPPRLSKKLSSKVGDVSKKPLQGSLGIYTEMQSPVHTKNNSIGLFA